MSVTMAATRSPRERELRGRGTRRYQLPMHDDSSGPNPSGLCMCGCGEATPLAPRTRRGLVKDQPVRYLNGHAPRSPLSDEGRRAVSAANRDPARRARVSATLRGHSISQETATKIAEGLTIHGHSKRVSADASPTYRSWQAMKHRCLNPRATKWDLYGGRGITVCARWMRFDTFLSDMGERPDGTSLDRIDPNGNYEPGNCRWATPLEQRHNRRA